MKERKTQLIKARVSTIMKRGIDDLARQRGESEAVIVREALSQYLTSKQNCSRHDWLSVISDGSAKKPQKNKNLNINYETKAT
jgi:predicted transcriptional regulator